MILLAHEQVFKYNASQLVVLRGIAKNLTNTDKIFFTK